MSNIVYEDKLYNEDIKKEFMSQYGSGTKKTLARIFKVSQSVETYLGKDLYDFNREEIRRLLFLYKATTIYSSKQNISWISKYIDWSIEEGYLQGINPLSVVDKDWAEQFVNKVLKKYWTEEELEKIIRRRINTQDKAVIILLMNGAWGKGHSEILNLKKSHIDRVEDKLKLINEEGNERCIEVSKDYIEILINASLELEYFKMNGEPDKDSRSEKTNLIDNDYVIKSSNTNTTHFDEAEKNIIYRRISQIANDINEPNFTPRSIAYSGMLAKAKKVYDQAGKLEKEKIEEICNQFGVNMEQSIYRIRQEFLNLETLKSVYET